MASLNQWVAKQQKRTLLIGLGILVLIVGSTVLLIPKKSKKVEEPLLNLTGIVDESFSKDNAMSAMTAQQAELETLKQQMHELKVSLEKREKDNIDSLSNLMAQKIKEVKEDASIAVKNQAIGPQEAPVWGTSHAVPKLHSVQFNYHKPEFHLPSNRLSADKYVPSGTFVRAVVLGGADADASVNGQSKNNGVMLFKLLQAGTLPNGQHSHLEGCFVTASSYGDISSERAYVVLDRLSCALPGRPIIDKAVTGWAFFGGKVGIKGVPLMRDNKIMQWAGISGAMSGIASAAQYAQSIQSISPLGSATSVPSTNVAPYAAYGGASKAAEVLSNYYVKRAEQYHPVIQVGSGNFVTIVFKEGFFLEPDNIGTSQNQRFNKSSLQEEEVSQEMNDFVVPQQVMDKALKTRE